MRKCISLIMKNSIPFFYRPVIIHVAKPEDKGNKTNNDEGLVDPKSEKWHNT